MRVRRPQGRVWASSIFEPTRDGAAVVARSAPAEDD
jgi:hypothetical protein